MLKSIELPCTTLENGTTIRIALLTARVTNLDTSLADVDGDNFTHDRGCWLGRLHVSRIYSWELLRRIRGVERLLGGERKIKEVDRV